MLTSAYMPAVVVINIISLGISRDPLRSLETPLVGRKPIVTPRVMGERSDAAVREAIQAAGGRRLH